MAGDAGASSSASCARRAPRRRSERARARVLRRRRTRTRRAVHRDGAPRGRGPRAHPRDARPARGDDAVEYILQACEAIAEAHALGIVHRDIKPANLFLAAAARRHAAVKVLDFGISKATNRRRRTRQPDADHDAHGLAHATCRPSRSGRRKVVDARADIWSLGVVLYELLAAPSRSEATTVTEVCAAVLEELPRRRYRDLRPEVPPISSPSVARCHRQGPDERYARRRASSPMRSYRSPPHTPSSRRSALRRPSAPCSERPAQANRAARECPSRRSRRSSRRGARPWRIP